MKKPTMLFLFGAVLLVSAASVVFGAGRPATSQSSSSTAKKKKATAAKSKKKSKTAKGQMAPTADRVREIQAALQKDGSYEGEPNGKWDAATIDAMRKYQDKNGITPTGKIDALTLNKLGLGSQTAGKGAPVPPAPPAPTPISATRSNSPSGPPSSVTSTDPSAK